MPQTFYIEPDEEIISVIGRLRKSGSEKNFFVFPKRALVLQSIINLRLFQREAQKLGKKVVIVTQDEPGRALAEKAGMETEHYSDDFSRTQVSHVELVAKQPQPLQSAPVPITVGNERIAPHSDMIGSSDFHSASRIPSQEPLHAPNAGQKLRIRNASPERYPSLTSTRHAEDMARTRSSSDMRPVRPVTDPAPIMSAPSSSSRMAPAGQNTATPRGERLRNFFADRGTISKPVSQPTAPVARTMSPDTPVMGRHAVSIFAFFGIVIVLLLVGVGAVFFLPKATVHATPHKTIQNADMQLDALADGGMPSSEESVPARIIEKDVPASVTVTATGASGSSNQKARGTVVIYNAFGKDPQPLVATTRLETSDGKIFRLTESVVVPGMTDIGGKDTAGAIETTVIADQAGSEYNIDAAEFTIPGFKGGSKYAKFSAKSTKSFVGGSSTGSGGMPVVVKADMEKAEREAKEKAKGAFLEEMKGMLTAGERILEESIEVIPRAQIASQVGTAASSFEYQNTFQVRAFVFMEEEVRMMIEKKAATDVQGIMFHPVSVTLAYGEATPDYDRRSVRIRAHALITLESDIDQERFRSALAGQDEQGIAAALEAFPGVKKISVDFDPEWFVTSVPKSLERISIILEPGEE